MLYPIRLSVRPKPGPMQSFFNLGGGGIFISLNLKEDVYSRWRKEVWFLAGQESQDFYLLTSEFAVFICL